MVNKIKIGQAETVTINTNTSVNTTPVRKTVSLFGGSPLNNENMWSYDFGQSDWLAAGNDSLVYNFQQHPNQVGSMASYLAMMMQMMGAANNNSLEDMFKKLMGNINQNSSITTGGGNKTTETGDSEEVKRLKKELEDLKKEIDKANDTQAAKELRRLESKKGELALENEKIVTDLYDSMDGWITGTDNDKLAASIKKVNEDNVVEIFDNYVKFAEENGDYNTSLIKDIYNDHTMLDGWVGGLGGLQIGAKSMQKANGYYNKLATALSTRAKRLLDAEGVKSGITQEQIDEFKSKFEKSKNGKLGSIEDNLDNTFNDFITLINKEEQRLALEKADNAQTTQTE